MYPNPIASNYSGLRKALKERDERYRQRLQNDVDAVVERKQKAIENGGLEEEAVELQGKQRAQDAQARKTKYSATAGGHKCLRGKTFDWNSKLGRHLPSQRESDIVCSFLLRDQKFKEQTSADNYYRRTHTDRSRVACPFCGRKFLTKFNMIRHRDSMHEHLILE